MAFICLIGGADVVGSTGPEDDADFPAPKEYGYYDITTATYGQGTINRAPGVHLVPWGETISITAEPASGYLFSHWIGDVDLEDQTSNPLSLWANRNKTVGAVFVPKLAVLSTSADVLALRGDTVRLEVKFRAPTGTTYQWYRNGSAIAGASQPTLQFEGVDPSINGYYQVVAQSTDGNTARSREIEVSVGGFVFNPESIEVARATKPIFAAGGGFFLTKDDNNSLTLLQVEDASATEIKQFAFSSPVMDASIQDGILAIEVQNGNDYYYNWVYLYRLHRGLQPELIATLSAIIGDRFTLLNGFYYSFDGDRVRAWHLDDPSADPISSLVSPSTLRSGVIAGTHLYYHTYDNRLKTYDISNPYDIQEVGGEDGISAPGVLQGDILVCISSEGLELYQLNDPVHPTFLEAIPLDGFLSSLTDTGRYILANVGGKIVFIDVMNPATRGIVASFDGPYGESGFLTGQVLLGARLGVTPLNDIDLLAPANLQVAAQGGEGTVQASPSQSEMPAGTTVTLQANPAEGFYFDRWYGEIEPSLAWDNPSSFPLLRDARIVASILPDPSITASPEEQILFSQDDLILKVEAGGGTPLSYQWYLDGAPIAGANSNMLAIPAGGNDRSGTYEVRISNEAGTKTSSSARVVETTSLDLERLCDLEGSYEVLISDHWLMTRAPAGAGLLVYDISDPFVPVVVDHFPGEAKKLVTSPDGNLAAYIDLQDEVHLLTVDRASGITHAATIPLADGTYVEKYFHLDNDRLYVQSAGVVRVFDLSDRSNPQEIIHVDLGAILSMDGMAVAKGFAYGAPRGSGKIPIIDLRNETYPTYHVSDGHQVSNFGKLWTTNGYLFRPIFQDIEIFGLSDPANPQLLQTLSLGKEVIDISPWGPVLIVLLEGTEGYEVRFFRRQGEAELYEEISITTSPLPWASYPSLRRLGRSGRYLAIAGSGLHLFDLLDQAVLGLSTRGDGHLTTASLPPTPEAPEGSITIEAVAADDWYFSHWTGDVPDSIDPGTGSAIRLSDVGENPITVSLDQSRHLRAIFFPSPSIHRHPRDQIARAGETVELHAVARGATPLSLQWQKDGVDLPGSTEETLSLPVVQERDSGVYRLVASTDGRTVYSDPAELMVVPIHNLRPKAVYPAGVGDWHSGVQIEIHANQLFALKDRLEIFSLSDPADPQLIGFIEDVSAFCFVGDYLYTSGPSAPLIVWDLSDPQTPAEVARITSSDLSPHASIRSDRLLHLGDRVIGDGNSLGRIDPFAGNFLNRYDVSDPATPVFVGTSPGARPETPAELGLFLSSQLSGEPRVLLDMHYDHVTRALEMTPPAFGYPLLSHGGGLYLMNPYRQPHEVNYLDWDTDPAPSVSRGTIESGVSTFTRWGKYGYAFNNETYESLVLRFDANDLPKIEERYSSFWLFQAAVHGGYLYGVGNTSDSGTALIVVEWAPTPELSVSVSGPGSVTGDPASSGPLAPDSEVTLTAQPAEGYEFTGWIGTVPAGQEHSNPLVLTMSKDRNVTAVFLPSLEIYESPRDQIAMIWDQITLRVESYSGASIQWYKDGNAINGANGSELTVAINSPSDGGRFHAVLTKGGTTRSTKSAEITVLDHLNPTRRDDLGGLPTAETIQAEGQFLQLITVDGHYQRYDLTTATPDRPVVDVPLEGQPEIIAFQDDGTRTILSSREAGKFSINESDYASPSIHPGTNHGPLGNPLWGPYGYQLTTSGIQVLKFDDLAFPNSVGGDQSGSLQPSVWIGAARGHLYHDGFYNHLSVYSLDDPQNPLLVEQPSVIRTPGSNNIELGVDWMLLINGSQIQTVSLADPEFPAFSTYHEIEVTPVAQCLVGSYLFVAADSGGIALYHIVRPTRIIRVDAIGPDGLLSAGTRYRQLEVEGSQLFAVTDEGQVEVYQLNGEVRLDLEIEGDGTIVGGESGYYPYGQSVSLSAQNPAYVYFSHWEIDGSRIQHPERTLKLELRASISVRAVFNWDGDRDWIPDWWENNYFGGTADALSADRAYSGIGLQAHYLFGIDPHFPASGRQHLPYCWNEGGTYYLRYTLNEGAGEIPVGVYGFNSLEEEPLPLEAQVDYEIADTVYHGNGTRDVVIRFLVDPPRWFFVGPLW